MQRPKPGGQKSENGVRHQRQGRRARHLRYAIGMAIAAAASTFALPADTPSGHHPFGGTVPWWDAFPPGTYTEDTRGRHAGVSPDGARFYALRDGAVAAYRASDGSELWTRDLTGSELVALEVSALGTVAVLGYDPATNEVFVLAIHGETGNPLWVQIVAGSGFSPVTLALNPASGRLAVVHRFEQLEVDVVSILDVATGSELYDGIFLPADGEPAATSDITFSADGARLYALLHQPLGDDTSRFLTVAVDLGPSSGFSYAWEQPFVNGYTSGGTLVPFGHSTPRALALSPDGAQVVVTGITQHVCNGDTTPEIGETRMIVTAYDAGTGVSPWTFEPPADGGSTAGDPCFHGQDEGWDVAVSSNRVVVTGRHLPFSSTLFQQVTIALDRTNGEPVWTNLDEERTGVGLLHARLLLTPDESLAIVTGSQDVAPLGSGCVPGNYARIRGISTSDGSLLKRDLWLLDCTTGPQDHAHDAVLSPSGRHVFSVVHRGLSGSQALTALSLDGSVPGDGDPPGGGDPVDPTSVYTAAELAGDDEHTNPEHLVNAGGTLFFTLQPMLLDNFYPRLHRIDDSMPESTLVKDFGQDPDLDEPTYVNGLLFFRATAITDPFVGSELWKSDGTSDGTVLVKDIHAGTSGSLPLGLTAVGNTLFFDAGDALNGREVWKSDGTEAGTVMVKDIRPGTSGSSPSSLTNVNGVLFFAANDGVHGSELWKSDGTSAGTVMVRDIQFGSSSPTALAAVGSTLFFSASTQTGRELWKSDGTEAGTVLVKDINPSGSSNPNRLTAVGGTLFFVADDGVHGRELWRSNGTTEGTVLVKDIRPGSTSSVAELLVDAGGALFFTADDGVHGREVWKSDGTPAGTVMVKDVRPGGQDGIDLSFDPSLVALGGLVFFQANDGVTGIELWKSNGIEAGTVLVADIPNAARLDGSSVPQHLTAVGDTLYFSAGDGVRNDGSGGPRRRLYRVFRQAVVEPPPDPESPLLVRCLHSPILPQAGQPLTITAEALTGDILGTSTTALEADEIEIWIDDADGRSLRAMGQHTDTLTFETTAVPLPPSFMMGYACRVRLGDQVVFSGWRQTSTITLRGATPLIYTGPASERIDVVFIADDGTYSGPFGSAFHADIVELIRNGFYDFPLYGGLGTVIGDRFNFWLAEDMGNINPNDDDECGPFSLRKPATWKDFYAFADEGIIVHRRAGFRDCAQLGVHSVEMGDDDSHRVLRHEAGHRPFGLADEYCRIDDESGDLICDGGYFQSRAMPNLYRTLRACEDDAADLGRTADSCRTFTSTHPLGRTWFTSEPQPEDLMFNNTVPRAADIRRILWMYQRCAEGKC